MPKAKPSTRSSGKVNVNFGIISIQVDIFTGTVSTHGVERHEYVQAPKLEPEPVVDNTTGEVLLDRLGKPIHLQQTMEKIEDDGTIHQVPVFEDHPVGRGQTDKATGELIRKGQEIVKKITTEYGPVFVSDSEIEQLFQLTPDTIEIDHFQPLHLFHQGHYVPKSIAFLEPRKTGTGSKKGYDATQSKLLLTLLAGMRDRGALAVCTVTTRGVPKPAIMLPDGTLWYVWHTDALREQREFPEVPVSDAETEMMGKFIDTLWTTDPVDLTDERSALIQGFADEKAAAGDFGKPADVEVALPEPTATADIMALLAASVEQAKQTQAAAS